MANKWFDILKPKAGSDTAKVMLYDDIGSFGKSAKDFVTELNAIKAKTINVHINSNGGEIFDGCAIYNAIKGHDAEVTTHIDGIAASIASVIALAGDKVCMAKNAWVCIHNPWAFTAGDAADMRKQADNLDKFANTLAQTYADETGKPLADVKAAMDCETWFNCEEAKAWGLVDEIEGEGDEGKLASSALLAVAKYQKVPPALRRFAASAARNITPKMKETHMAKIATIKFKAGVSNHSTIPCPHCNEDINVELETPDDVEATEQNRAALAKAREDGMKGEREYRAMFNTVLSTAGLDAAGAADFEKQFYGRSEPDLKFLASHAIGQRTTPVGEQGTGNGEGENGAAAKAKQADEALVADATKRFNAEPRIRRMFGVLGSVAETDPVYKNALTRYVASAQKQAADEAKQAAGTLQVK